MKTWKTDVRNVWEKTKKVIRDGLEVKMVNGRRTK